MRASVQGVLLFVIAFVGAFFFVEKTYAATPVQWAWSSSSAIGRDLSTSFAPYSSQAIQDYDSTDLTFTRSTTYGGSNAVYYQQSNYGAFGGTLGVTTAYSGSTNCVDANYNSTGYCNTTNHKVNLAYVNYNTYYAGQFGSDPNSIKFVAEHETGHAFGLAHVANCTISSIMQGAYGCVPQPTTLQTQDRQTLNSLY